MEAAARQVYEAAVALRTRFDALCSQNAAAVGQICPFWKENSDEFLEKEYLDKK